jgi:PAS domain S-box-containing protein
MQASGSQTAEIHHLRTTLRELVALTTLPAVWAEYSPEAILRSLAEVFLNTLALDLFYIRVHDPSTPALEVLRSPGRDADAHSVQTVLAALQPWLTAGNGKLPTTIRMPLGGDTWRITAVPFGHAAIRGIVVAGSQRPDFPSEADRLLLEVGTNQAALVLQRKRDERILAEERERLRITLSSIGDAVIATDPQARVTFMNGGAETLTGWSQTEAVGRPLTEVFHILHEQTRQIHDNPALHALRAGTVVGLANHTVLIARGGTERPIDDSAAPMRGSDGTTLGAVLVFRDVSERKQAETARARLAAIVESSDDAIVSKNLNGIILTWNAGAERLFGYTAEEAVGRSITLIIPQERLDEERMILERLRRGERIDHFETVRVSKGGRQIDISLTVSPLRDSEGQIIGASKIARDITLRKRAEAVLRESEGRHRFLANLAAATQPLADPHEVLQTTARLLAEYLEVDRCAYAEVEPDMTFQVTGDYSRGAPSIVGRWPGAAFGTACLQLLRANEPFIVDDVQTDPRLGPEDLPTYHATAIRAVIAFPLHKEGRLIAVIAVHQKTPRRWSAAEVDLVRLVVGRCWETLERVRVARDLRESEERQRKLADNLPAGFIYQIIHGPEGARRFTYVSGGVEALCGVPPEAILADATNLYRLILAEDQPRVAAQEAAAFHSRELFDCQFQIQGAGGHIRWLHCRSAPRSLPDGGAVWDGIALDVTERAKAEQALAESREHLQRVALEAAQAAQANAKFRAFFEQGTNFAGVLTLDGILVEANRLSLEACGFTREEVIGRPFWDTGWWNRSPALQERVRSACLQAAGGQQFRAESNYFVADGTERMVDLILAPVTDETGRVLFVAATGTDITERKQMEDVLRENDRKKDDFIALLAHELRNPLAPIRNGLQVLRLAEKDPEAAAQALGMMNRQLSHMVRLIDDLLDVSRINRNKMELRRERVLLADVVGSAVETARPMIEAAGHELTVTLPGTPVYLDADLTRLAQVFSNLLTNSAKYTEPGGQIRLSAQRRDGEVVIMVRDNGIGIPAEALRRIFDMFSQVDRSIERATGGLGIGLALVKGLVEMHGGTVTAASPGPGQGSTFTVTLPLPERATAPESAAAEDAGQSARPRRRILVVDDNRDGAESMAMMLRLLGNEVLTAHDGLEAVEEAEWFRPEVILMDVGMPRLNGYEATRRIREQLWGQTVAIIALTGWGQEGDRERSREAGCNGHLVKPVNLPELEKLLSELPAQPTQPGKA